MYHIVKEILNTEDGETEEIGIADDNGLMIAFTEDPEEAEKFVRLCNENEVEENHVADLIEDYFYS